VRVVCVGLLKSRKDIITKKGDRMSFLTFEDQQTTAEVVLFPKTFAAVEQQLQENCCFLIRGTIDQASTKLCKIKADNLIVFDTLWDTDFVQKVELQLPAEINETMLESIKTELTNSGAYPVDLLVRENNKTVRLALQQKIHFDASIGQAIEKLGVRVALIV
jgi:DNA polymerase-3 subunit alpha